MNTARSKKKLAIVTTHPIQYNAPLFKLLEERGIIKPVVFYTHHNTKMKFDPGFGRKIEWDIPLTEGYEHHFIENAEVPKQSAQWQQLINNELIKAIKEHNCDAVLVFGWNYYNHMNVMRYFKGKIPVYFRGDSTLLDDIPGFRQMLRRQFLRKVYAYVDKAFYVGKNNKDYFEAHGLGNEQLIYAPHAIHNDRFRVLDEKLIEFSESLKSTLQLLKNDRVVLFLGKLESKKAPDVFVEAALQDKTSNNVWVLTGNGIMEEELKKKAENMRNIRFLQFQNQSTIPALYHLANVVVLPSRGPNETWGLVLNEAMACGKAVIATERVGAALDLIDNGHNGYIIKPNNPGQLLNAVERVLDNWKHMGAYSGEKINDWSYIHICKAIEQTLLEE